MNKWITLRLGQNAIDDLLDQECLLKRKLADVERKRKALEADVNLAFDIAMKVENLRGR